MKGIIKQTLIGALLAAIIVMAVLMFTSMGSGEKSSNTANKAQDQRSQAEIYGLAQDTVPVPSVKYFTERQTIKKFSERYDKPNVITYVYLVSYGQVLGYFVANGKPASIRSYLVPEDMVYGNSSGGYTTQSAPNIDGTYGEDNPGIRFFTAEGVAIEWGGGGASYFYSDAPVPLGVPKLNPAPPKQ